MGYAYAVDERRNLVLVQLWGELDYGEELSAMAEVLSDPRLQPGVRILGDRRQATIASSSRQILQAVEVVGDIIARLGTPRVAIVVATDLDFGLMRMFEMQAEFRLRHDMRIFRSLEEACAWLEADVDTLRWPAPEQLPPMPKRR